MLVAVNAPGKDKPHASEFDYCSADTNCLSIDIEGLCGYTKADFNYYAVCRSILSSYAQDESGMFYAVSIRHS